MNTDDLTKELVKTAIGFFVPTVAKSILPPAVPRQTIPVMVWCVAGFVGGLIGGLCIWFISATYTAGSTPALVTIGSISFDVIVLSNMAVFGAVMGFFEWFALRGFHNEGQSPLGNWFIFASIAGWASFALNSDWGWVFVGAAVGVLQIFSLTGFKLSFVWVVFNVIAWPTAGWLSHSVNASLLLNNPDVSRIVGWALVGLIGAVVLIVPLKVIEIANKGQPQLAEPAH